MIFSKLCPAMLYSKQCPAMIYSKLFPAIIYSKQWRDATKTLRVVSVDTMLPRRHARICRLDVTQMLRVRIRWRYAT